jgi:hypothetical protein
MGKIINVVIGTKYSITRNSQDLRCYSCPFILDENIK